jgi:hypothetical protein
MSKAKNVLTLLLLLVLTFSIVKAENIYCPQGGICNSNDIITINSTMTVNATLPAGEATIDITNFTYDSGMNTDINVTYNRNSEINIAINESPNKTTTVEVNPSRNSQISKPRTNLPANTIPSEVNKPSFIERILEFIKSLFS